MYIDSVNGYLHGKRQGIDELLAVLTVIREETEKLKDEVLWKLMA